MTVLIVHNVGTHEPVMGWYQLSFCSYSHLHSFSYTGNHSTAAVTEGDLWAVDIKLESVTWGVLHQSSLLRQILTPGHSMRAWSLGARVDRCIKVGLHFSISAVSCIAYLVVGYGGQKWLHGTGTYILPLRAAQGSHIINKARGSLLTAIYSVMSSGRVRIWGNPIYLKHNGIHFTDFNWTIEGDTKELLKVIAYNIYW